MVTSVPQYIAKQRDVRRWSNLNCAFRIASIRMGDFKRCTANSPFCLGMTDFCCCDSDDFVAETNIPVKRKQLSLGKPAKKAALSPSKEFENTISEEEVQKTSKGCIPVNATRSTRSALRTFTVSSAPLEITHPHRRNPGCTIQIRAPSDVTLLDNVLWFSLACSYWQQTESVSSHMISSKMH